MTERFKKLFTLEPNLYTENSPVIISAGALQFDNETGKILAQIKFKNISNKNIKCISVSIQQLDTIGRTLGEPILYQYLDLDINRDIEFGSKTPIYLSDQTARSFKIEITEIIFKDDTVWSPAKESIWESIPEQNKLYPNDSELLDQYHLDINPKGEKEFFKYKDIWKCSCGVINKENENSCHTCHFPLNKMENVNTEILMTSLQKRKEQEKLHEELSKKEEQYKNWIIEIK